MPKKIIEDVINDVLKDDAKINALDFIAHLRVIEKSGNISITINDEKDESGWNVSNAGFITIAGADDFPGSWGMWVGSDNIIEYSDFQIDEHIKEITWAHVAPCGNCNSECIHGKRITIFGKDFENVCNLIFVNPNAETVNCMKKIIDIKMITLH